VNALAILPAMVAMFWASYFAFSALDNPVIGYALIGGGLLMLVLAFAAFVEDDLPQIARGNGGGRGRGRGRR